MDTHEFNDRHFNPSLEMSSKANRSISMLGDMDMDLLKHDYHAPTNEFLDSLTSKLFPHILQPTRVSSSSKTLIDNIFSNTLSPDSVSRSHYCSLSLTVFLPHLQVVQIFDSDWTNFDQEKFILAYLTEDRNSAIQKRTCKSKSFF